MSGEFDLKTGRGFSLERRHLYEIALWHRQHGLTLGFSNHANAVVTLDGQATPLMTELLRLALIGQRTQEDARQGNALPMAIVDVAERDWRERLS